MTLIYIDTTSSLHVTRDPRRLSRVEKLLHFRNGVHWPQRWLLVQSQRLQWVQGRRNDWNEELTVR